MEETGVRAVRREAEQAEGWRDSSMLQECGSEGL